MRSIYNDIVKKKKKISVIGLGYVGLPIALAFARKVSVIGFDINDARIRMIKNKKDPSNELDPKAFSHCDIHFTSAVDDLKQASFHIIAVPTPINSYKQPDLEPLLSATKTVGQVLKKGDYVVYESTVYPGATEDDCIPLLEKLSGLKHIKDFKAGYSPERINPGDKKHSIDKIVKIVSGCDDESLDNIAKVYELIITAGIYRASSIKVAEAAKIIENTQRDVNIALMNELSILFNRIGINTFEVLEAAATKWNFLTFSPGLVGGHCIGVDPYYLTYKANKLGYNAQVINSGRDVNDSMGSYLAKELVKKIIKTGKNILDTRILVMGVTFKENVSDIRNTKVIDVIRELKSFGASVDVTDPYASSSELKEEYGIELIDTPENNYDAVILAVPHDSYLNLDEKYFTSITKSPSILVDVKGLYRNKVKKMDYFSL